MEVLHPGIKILVVDDFPTMRRIIKTLLKQNGYSNFSEAEDGELALKVLKKEGPFDLIVSDWNMPKMTGIELLKTVRADPELKDTPFLMVTAEADKDNIIITTVRIKTCLISVMQTSLLLMGRYQ